MGFPVWSRFGNYGDKWNQAQLPVNNQTASYQYVIEGVRGRGFRGDIAIDDISLRDSCTAGGNEPSKPMSVDNNRSTKVATFAFSTRPAALPSQEKGTTKNASRITIIATTIEAAIFLCILVIVLLVNYKRWKRASILSPHVNTAFELNETSPVTLTVDEEQDYEIVTRINQEFNDDAVTSANKSEGTSAESVTSHYEDVEVQSCYETQVQNGTYPETKSSQENAGYTVLDVNRLRDRNTRDDGTYQKLVKPTSSYVIPQDDRTEPCENMKMEINLPDYTELDQSKRNAENYPAYQTLLKT
ncbi:MAM domain-containing glycosylphosphatidylinositol anchor 2-like [Paramuricea clavata]|uniref:MAM domain-containing glycosylphosphatidylinositol anchor 2-like, partial n=1 Tax=Paramuricea clavata TaxID=317549 RepID=A0A7D9J4D0_PARCT|nr:MAM domain-containing glycosylphosphatidylinositol anchor 2-like [Paramuricea clavata]